MLITFRGLKSGRVFTTPVRYIRYEKSILCFSSTENNWWRNLLGGAEVKLKIKGREDSYLATAITEPEETKKWLLYYLELFPEDAVYHNIRLEKNKRLNPSSCPRKCLNEVSVSYTHLTLPTNREV